MSKPLHQPHDKLFKSTFQDKATAAAFFRQHLPHELIAYVDWSSLALQPGSYIDDRFRASESDLLYRVQLSDMGEGQSDGFVYLLFEHQRQEDRWLALRLLGYLVRIWDRFLRQSPQADILPIVIPIVLAQNRRKWAVAPRFRALLGLPVGKESVWTQFVPDFVFRLVELAGLRFEEIAGTPLGILTLRVLKAERTGDLMGEAVWDEALLRKLEQTHLPRILHYIFGLADLDTTTIEQKIRTLKTIAIRKTAMTVAEQYIQKGRVEGREAGRNEGRQEGVLIGRIQVLQSLLGKKETPAKVLAKQSLARLRALQASLEAQRR